MLMSANWRHISAIPMPTALTQRAASTARVEKALKEMGSTVQVFNNDYTALTTKYTPTHTHYSCI